jgi:hypothetical protein
MSISIVGLPYFDQSRNGSTNTQKRIERTEVEIYLNGSAFLLHQTAEGHTAALRSLRARLRRLRGPAGLTLIHSRVVILSAEQAKHVGDEENQQYCPQPYAGPTPRTPAGMAVVPSTEAKNQY